MVGRQLGKIYRKVLAENKKKTEVWCDYSLEPRPYTPRFYLAALEAAR